VNEKHPSELSGRCIAYSTPHLGSNAVPVLDASALCADPEGLEFLRDVLGTRDEIAAPNRRFPVEAWMPKAAAFGLSSPGAEDAGARPTEPARCRLAAAAV
jgi:hypothetical protein